MCLSSSLINTDCLTPKLGRSISCPANISPRTSRGNDKGLYATMRGGRIDPSSCLDTCWVDDMGVGSGFEILTFPETFLPFSLHFQNKSLFLQSTGSRTLK